MNLLIVDDEISSIQAVKNMLDPEEVGIEEVYTALSADEGREILSSRRDIQLLLCDIEMPGESGLDLLEWINQKELGIYCIYMTCYAEFSYAQRAVELGSRAYLLKPILPEELKAQLRRGVDAQNEMARLKMASRSMEENEARMARQFFRDLFYEEISSDAAVIRSEIRQLQLSIDPDWSYGTLLLSVRQWGDHAEAYGENGFRDARYAIRNVTQELLEETADDSILWKEVLLFGKNSQILIYAGSDGQRIRACMETFAARYQETERRLMPTGTVCYIGRVTPIEKVAEEMEGLLRKDSNHLNNRGIVRIEERPALEMPEANMDEKFRRWAGMLENGAYDKVRLEMIGFLETQGRNAWFTHARFRYFLSHYAGMLTGFGEKHDIPMSRLTADREHAEIFERSDQGLDMMTRWINCSVKQLQELQERESSDPVLITRRFIEEHLSEEIDVAQIAENVYLNQDYLTRIFKRETGSSIKKYMVDLRMEKAGDLLVSSRLPIADVAYRVGYGNYTSFNKIFRKTYGTSPQNYRKQNRSSGDERL